MRLSDDPRRDLIRLGNLPDDRLDPAEGALALAALERPHRERTAYRALLAEMVTAVAAVGAAETVAARAGALREVLAGRFRLIGDDSDESELENANAMAVLDRRRGLPMVLAIVWLHVGRSQGWRLEPLAFPTQCLVRLTDAAGGRAVVDPAGGGCLLEAADMRALLKAGTGMGAEMAPAHYAELSNRAVLLRLQTLVKLRHLRQGHFYHAAETVESMLLFAPDQLSLWRESGLMQLRQGNLRAAVTALEQFVARAPNSTARHRTVVLLQELREKLV